MSLTASENINLERDVFLLINLFLPSYCPLYSLGLGLNC